MSILKIKWNRYIPHSPTPKQIAFLSLPHEEALYGGAAGGGKILQKGQVLLTPFGWKKCEDLQLGDRVNNPDGSISRITQLKAWETLEKWTVYFDDGTSTEVAEEHLWLAWRSGKRKKMEGSHLFGEAGAEVIPTRELKEWVDYAKNQQAKGIRPNWPLIPVCKPQRFNAPRKYPSNLCPYLLGALLGDGCITTSTIRFSCSTEDYLVHWKEEIGLEHSWDIKRTQPTSGQIRIIGEDRKFITEQLTKMKLLGTNSYTKFIPKEYLLASIEDRTALLQGLMDTDGFVDSRGQLYYCSMSDRLRKDVCFLVRSLGGTAKEFDVCEIYITLPFEIKPCRIKRKLDRYTKKIKPVSKRVIDVIPGGTVHGRCLSVSHPNGLYITNDFIVTHNSDSLLMIALQYFDCAGYKGIIFRRSLTDHKLPASILNRAKEWLAPYLKTGEVRFVPSEHTFYSQEGGMLCFGYMDKEENRFRYQSAEFMTICFDEASQFKNEDLLYMFSRMRRTATTKHIPLRFRLASNPGGRNHAGIKKRFKIERDPDGEFRGHDLNRPFIQAKVPDNPHLDGKQYERQLDKLDPVTRDRLKSGDWSASEAAIYKDEWFQYRWIQKGDFYTLTNHIKTRTYHKDQLFIFGTTDVAGSEKTGLEGKVFFQNQESSFSVYCIWAMTPDHELILLSVHRYQCTIPNFIHKAVEITREWKPALVIAESNSINLGFTQGCSARGIPIYPVPSITDKIVRSTSAQLLAEEYHIWLPTYADWLADFEDEAFVWQGLKGEVDDQIDNLSLAGGYVAHKRYGSDMQPGMTSGRWTAAPSFSAGLFPTRMAGARYQGGLFSAKARGR